MKKILTGIFLIILATILVLGSCGEPEFYTTQPSTYQPTWTAPSTSQPTFTHPASTQPTSTQPGYTVAPTTTSPSTIGLAVGGSKDINNFRENIQNDYLPLPTDITYEGLFYDYYFDTGIQEPTRKLYSPSYSYAVTRDPFSGETEYYLSVGLNSGLREEDFARKKLNLVIVLDVSGSMEEQYDQYYYDRFGKRQDAYEGEGITRLTKIQSATDAVVSILDQLNWDDRLAIVTFNSNASVFQRMEEVRYLDMNKLKNRVLDIRAGGNTNMSAGMERGTQEFAGYHESGDYEYENRIILLTDAQPNTGDLSSSGMLGRVQKNASAAGIYTTFIGVGVDFNSYLIEEISKVKGVNYYTVHSPREFRERISEEFEFMVTPLVFNLRLDFDSYGWRIEKVFGSPEADETTGSLMRINTLFPSKSEGGENKGGLVLLKLRKMTSQSGEGVYLRVTYEDRYGRTDSDEEIIILESQSPEYFDNSGIRKGILLTRYAALMQNWLIDEYDHANYGKSWKPRVHEDTGIIIPVETHFSQWERQSLPLVVSQPYRWIFQDFREYFANEMHAIRDYTLEKEIEILDILCNQ
jgi:Ca-activated chloride channel family protein